jgi:hypothetical protein
MSRTSVKPGEQVPVLAVPGKTRHSRFRHRHTHDTDRWGVNFDHGDIHRTCIIPDRCRPGREDLKDPFIRCKRIVT